MSTLAVFLYSKDIFIVMSKKVFLIHSGGVPHSNPYITARNTSEAIEFYKKAFGTVENG